MPQKKAFVQSVGIVLPQNDPRSHWRSSASLIRSFVCRIWLPTVLGLVAVLSVGSQLLEAAVVEAWVQRDNNAPSPNNTMDHGIAVVMDGSGNVVATGASGGNYYMAKYAGA